MNTVISRLISAAALLTLLLLIGCSQTPTESDATATIEGAELTDTQRDRYLKALDAAAEGDYPTATDSLHRLSREQPKHAGTWLNLAAIYYQSEQPERTHEALEKAKALEPDNGLILNLQGALALDDGDIDQAEQYYRSALEKDPELAEAHYNLGLLYDTYYQDLASAISHYQAYLDLLPEDDNTTREWVQQLQRSLDNQSGG